MMGIAFVAYIPYMIAGEYHIEVNMGTIRVIGFGCRGAVDHSLYTK
jgi:hypothetical protein